MASSIVLDERQAEALKGILESQLGDLKMEIAGTDDYEFRQVLKEREALVKDLIALLAADQGRSGIRAAVSGGHSERDMFMALEERVALRRSWTMGQLWSAMRQVQGQKMPGIRWEAFEHAVPAHSQWPRGRVIALLMRAQSGDELESAGFGELLHEGD